MLLKAFVYRCSGIYRDLVSQQNFPTGSLSEESDFCISLTTNNNSHYGLPVRELVGHVNINNIPKLIEPTSVIDGVKWFGMNYCSDCNLIDTYCTCQFEAQSGEHGKMFNMQSTSQQQNVTFSDNDDPYALTIEGVSDPTRCCQDTNDADLANFFSRPIKIFEKDWTQVTSFTMFLNPWKAFFENPRVENRIANFKLLRCKLHIKVLINGNAFHYGRLMMYYEPMETWNQFSRDSTNSIDAVQESQFPKIFLDPCTSQGGEMTLPFFWHQNYLDIGTKGWNDMGGIGMRELTPLKHANGANDIVSVSVFAWAEDVSLSVLTSRDAAITPQSGEEIDQANATGVVSGPATAVARIAAHMVKVPYIGPFAMATSMAANTTAAIAQLFGYSRPPVTRAPVPYRPTTVSSLALTNVPDVSQKLTVDHKQELTIDPRISGVGGLDPLNIREIAKRESWLTRFSWPVSTSTEALLWNGRVTPVTWNESGNPLAPAYHLPACAFAALPFKYWTGTMKFRFQIVASAYHKGRLKIVYDPDFIASNEYNVNYLRIVDIAEEKDFTVEVGIGQEITLLSHHLPGPDSMTQVHSTTAYASKEAGNGVLAVYVVNELTVPNSVVNNDIEINVFVSMGDDFEVFVPRDKFQAYTFFEPQSGEENAPEQDIVDPLGPGSTYMPNTSKVWTGESITSFRTMLKRYSVWTTLADPGTRNVLTGRFNRFPYYRGAYTNAADRAFDDSEYSYCNTLLLHWVRLAYMGSRGSIRYKIIPRGIRGLEVNQMSVSLATNDGPAYQHQRTTIVAESLVSSRKKIMYNDIGGVLPANQTLLGTLGASVTTGGVNPTLEFEVPYYHSSRFEPGRVENYVASKFMSTPWNYRIESGSAAVTGSAVYDIYVAAGEDFQCYWFVGLPKFYYEPVPPA
jgi:hypothetical protein